MIYLVLAPALKAKAEGEAREPPKMGIRSEMDGLPIGLGVRDVSAGSRCIVFRVEGRNGED